MAYIRVQYYEMSSGRIPFVRRGKHLRADIIVHDTGSRAMISWHVACTYASELQAMEEELDLCYQDGVVFCATSNTAIGFPLFFRNWKLS